LAKECLDGHAKVGNEPSVTVNAAAEEAIANEDACFEEHAAMADPDQGVIYLQFQEELWEAQLLGRNLRFVQYYWKELTNIDEHLRLQNAVKQQLYREQFGDSNNGNEVEAFDPFEGYKSS